jgi:hypothetical protein
MANNIIKSLLIGLIAGVLIGFTGEDWNFKMSYYAYGIHAPENKVVFGKYGTSQAVIGGIIVSLICFLMYNKNKK